MGSESLKATGTGRQFQDVVTSGGCRHRRQQALLLPTADAGLKIHLLVYHFATIFETHLSVSRLERLEHRQTTQKQQSTLPQLTFFSLPALRLSGVTSRGSNPLAGSRCIRWLDRGSTGQ